MLRAKEYVSINREKRKLEKHLMLIFESTEQFDVDRILSQRHTSQGLIMRRDNKLSREDLQIQIETRTNRENLRDFRLKFQNLFHSFRCSMGIRKWCKKKVSRAIVRDRAIRHTVFLSTIRCCMTVTCQPKCPVHFSGVVSLLPHRKISV